MKYATIDDLIIRYGGKEIAQVLDNFEFQDGELEVGFFEGDDFSEAKKELDAAINAAHDIVESAVRKVYVIPLQYEGETLETPPALLTELTCDIARFYLHDDRQVEEGTVDAITSRYNKAIKQAEELRSGNLDISADKLYESDEIVYHV